MSCGRRLRDRSRTSVPRLNAISRMPSNFRSKIHSGPAKRSCVSVAAIGSIQSGNGSSLMRRLFWRISRRRASAAASRALFGTIAASMLIGLPLAAALVAAPLGLGSELLQLQSADGRRSIVAIEAKTPPTLDGALDEDVWRAAQPAAD